MLVLLGSEVEYVVAVIKKLSDQQIIGQQGVHLLGERLLSHGLSFQPTSALDAGIDGFLELRDPATGEVEAQFISAQLKTRKSGSFSEETGESFSYICDQKDIDYWSGSNLPVILIIARLSDKLIFWKSIQTWFADPDRRRTRKVVFDKRKDVLDEAALPGFSSTVASFATPGLIVPSTRSAEFLDLNLLKVVYPERIHVAATELSYTELRKALVEAYGNPPIDWILHGKRICSFRDISLPPFRDVIEEGTEEWLGTREWFESDGEVTKRLFVQLLGRTLSEMVHEPLAYWSSKRYLFFKLRRDRKRNKFSYKSFEKQTSREVVKSYSKPGESKPSYYQHAAFVPNFIELGDSWYLAIEPTYHFTSDGYHEFRYASDRLSGIKRLETNQSVRGHVGMWKAFLIRHPDLLRHDALRFEAVPDLELPFGVPDDLWRGNEDEDEKSRVEKAQHELL
jgi:hypothetical protein